MWKNKKSKQSYQKQEDDPKDSPGICPTCGSGSWIATRPTQRRRKMPQEGKHWIDRAIVAFIISMGAAAALRVISIVAVDGLPSWAIWLLCAGAVSIALAGLMVIDGIAVESKVCSIDCAECGHRFEVPWRPNP